MDIGQQGAKGNFYIRVYVSYGESKKELIGATEFDVELLLGVTNYEGQLELLNNQNKIGSLSISV